jgi:very-short-patch-repair endonuclease
MIIHYSSYPKPLASRLRNESTKSEIRLWKYLKGKQLEVRFTRQKPVWDWID